jgi:lincosamide nucleotidyltransferase A/C/D/E
MQVQARVVAVAAAEHLFNAIAVGPLARIRNVEPLNRVRARWRRAMDVEFTLDDLVEVLHALDGVGVRSWLAGGWGVDALVGRQTRPHTDLDLVIGSDDLEKALLVLHERGFRAGSSRHEPEGFLPDRQLVRDRSGRVVELHFVDFRSWPAGHSLAEPFARGHLGGRPVDCLSPAVLRICNQRVTHAKPEYAANLRTLDDVERGRR